MPRFKLPTRSTHSFHNVDRIECGSSPENGGALSLTVFRDDWEAVEITIFTGHPGLSVALSEAINEVLVKHAAVVAARPKVAA